MKRRDFLKFAGTTIAASIFPGKQLHNWLPIELPKKGDLFSLPESIRVILELSPRLQISRDGYLFCYDPDASRWMQTTMMQTMWNKERSSSSDRLKPISDWSIVLHWFGDNDQHDLSVDGYLRGFDSLRVVADYVTRTSAHFLVGDAQPLANDDMSAVSILQTQRPDVDGTPFMASHLTSLDYIGHWQQKQYFVRALYSLAAQEPGVHSALQDYFDGPRLDANRTTIAIEITGSDFDQSENLPSTQKMANVVALVWALMRRYHIPAMNLLGHHEIQLSKADPGKKFMAWVRFLIGVKALFAGEAEMLALVFGSFYQNEGTWEHAARKYFKFVRDQLVLVSTPAKVYEWERTCGYWVLLDALLRMQRRVIRTVRSPLTGQPKPYGKHFLSPDSHEGLDFYDEKTIGKRSKETLPVHLFADGECLHIAKGGRCHPGLVAVFRHLQADGAELLSIYGNLVHAAHISVGGHYQAGDAIGDLDGAHTHADPYLHFALAYGAAWDTDEQTVAAIPLNAQSSWIQSRFLDPDRYLRSCGALACETHNFMP